MTRAFGDAFASFAISALDPTETMLSPATATPEAHGCLGLAVQTRAFTIASVMSCCFISVAHDPSAVENATVTDVTRVIAPTLLTSALPRRSPPSRRWIEAVRSRPDAAAERERSHHHSPDRMQEEAE